MSNKDKVTKKNIKHTQTKSSNASHEEKWNQHLEAAMDFYRSNNRLPKNGEELNGLQIGSWLKNQRNYYSRKTLKEERIERLNKNLPGWNTPIRKRTEKVEQNGNKASYLPFMIEEPPRPDTAFRYETIWGTGFKDAFDIVMYELFELYNIEILEYIKKNYCKRKLHFKLIDEAIKYLLSIKNKEPKKNSLLDSERVRIVFVSKLFDIVEAETGIGINYCVWLTDKETVKETYKKFIKTERDIDEYYISEAILVDKGKEGKLYAYENYPVPRVKVIPIE